MEILISLLVGLALMEAYAWLDTLAKWLINRAARQLPEENREALTEQWTADLEAMPNSLAKLVFAFCNCTLDVDNISDEICRGTFEAMADKVDELLEGRMVVLDQALQESMTRLQANELPGAKLISALNSSLERLERLEKNANDDARKAINHFRAVSPSITGPFSEFVAQIDQSHVKLETLTIGFRQSVALAAEINQRVRQRLLDDTPLDDDSDGQQLVDLFTGRIENITKAIHDLGGYFSANKIVAPENFAPKFKVVLDALMAAASAIKPG